jgi:transposase-like protein
LQRSFGTKERRQRERTHKATKARGVNDILIAVVDGLKGFPEAITSVFPQTIVQPASCT